MSPDIKEELLDVLFDESIFHDGFLMGSAHYSFESGNVMSLESENTVSFFAPRLDFPIKLRCEGGMNPFFGVPNLIGIDEVSESDDFGVVFVRFSLL